MRDILVNRNGTDGTFKKFLISLLEPLQDVTDDLKIFEEGELKRAQWNGQKIVLQAALNDIFGITIAPFILIETNQDITQNTFFYEISEGVSVYISEASELDPLYLFESSEAPGSEYDFKVLIPSGIWTTELERRIIAQVKLYKLAGPNFVTETY